MYFCGHVTDDEGQRDADRDAADESSRWALEAAEDGGGEGVDEDRLHERRREEELRGLGHQPGDCAEHGREPPADREHRVHPDADEGCGRGPQRGGSHPEAELREAEERPDEQRGGEHDPIIQTYRCRIGTPPTSNDGGAERRVHELELAAPDPVDDPVDEDEETDRDDDHGDQRVLQRPDESDLQHVPSTKAIASVAAKPPV